MRSAEQEGTCSLASEIAIAKLKDGEACSQFSVKQAGTPMPACPGPGRGSLPRIAHAAYAALLTRPRRIEEWAGLSRRREACSLADCALDPLV